MGPGLVRIREMPGNNNSPAGFDRLPTTKEAKEIYSRCIESLRKNGDKSIQYNTRKKKKNGI
jgi:hypothetical protein